MIKCPEVYQLYCHKVFIRPLPFAIVHRCQGDGWSAYSERTDLNRLLRKQTFEFDEQPENPEKPVRKRKKRKKEANFVSIIHSQTRDQTTSGHRNAAERGALPLHAADTLNSCSLRERT